jgi:hypothetical protein
VVTLRDAAQYITELPTTEQPGWRRSDIPKYRDDESIVAA